MQSAVRYVHYSSHKYHCHVPSNDFLILSTLFIERQEHNLCAIDRSTVKTFVQILYTLLKT